MRNLSSLNKPLAFHLAAMDISPLPPCRRQITTDSDGVYFATGPEQLRRQARRIWPDLKHISQADFYKRFYSKPPA